MKTRLLLTVGLFLALATPPAQADYVTVHGTVGKLTMPLVNNHLEGLAGELGTVEVWNRAMDIVVTVKPVAGRTLISKVYVYLDTLPAPPLPELNDVLKLVPVPTLLDGITPLPLTPEGTLDVTKLDEPNIDYLMEMLYAEPDYGEWPYGKVFKTPTATPYVLTVGLAELAALQWGAWGEPWLQKRLVTVAVLVELKTVELVPRTFKAWALNPKVPIGVQYTGWSANSFAQRYELQHPKKGNFVGPVHGLGYSTPTHSGTTGIESGGFSFYPGEEIALSIGGVPIGTAKADEQISPLDVFPSLEPSDTAVINMARLILSMDADGDANGSIDLTTTAALLPKAMGKLVPPLTALDFGNTPQIDAVIAKVVAMGGLPSVVSADIAQAWVEGVTGARLVRRNVSRTPEDAVDKPKLDIIPVWVSAKTANGLPTAVEYRDNDGNLIEVRDKAKPLVVTYMEVQEPNTAAGIIRPGSDIITAVSMDDGATWKRFNLSHMAAKSSFTLETGEKFPGDSQDPQQKIAEDKILVVWTSAYARGGKPSFAIRADDDYPDDDAYAVNDVWGVRGRQGSVNYNEDKDVGDQGIGEIPYYALWACRGVLVWEGNASKFPGREVGEVVWFKPERLTSGRRDAFFPMASAAKNVGFAVAWQEDPGGLLPGSCKGGGDGWSGATVHKKTDIWYSFIKYADFDLIDENWDVASQGADEQGPSSVDLADEHGQQPEISNRPKWLVPFSLAVRVSDNNTVNTDNLKVQLDEVTGLPLIDPVTGSFIPLDGALEEDFLATEHESEGSCEDPTDDHSGNNGTGGGWGMARYAYLLPGLSIADQSGSSDVWEQTVLGDYRPDSAVRWTRFVNKAGLVKTVAVTPDGRPLDGDTGACRPALTVMPGGWAILGYEETKGLGVPPEGEHGEETDVTRPEPDDKGKNIIYHSFKFDQPDLVSAGHILNLPALDDNGDLIPIFYKDAAGESTGIFRQYKTENARRIRFITQPKEWLTKYNSAERTSLVAVYRQGREGSGKPSDVFAVRAVVPLADMSNKSANPYKWSNLQRYETGAETSDPNVMRYQRKHMNMSAVAVESMDPVLKAGDGEGNYWNKVGKWKQYQGNLSDESFANPYSDAKAHRGFLRGDLFVFGYSFTPNWGRLGGDHMDFFVRRSFNGGKTFTTDPNGPEVTTHTVIERNPDTGEFMEKQYQYGRGEFEPGRNMSLLKGNKYTVIDPRLVPPMGPGTVNPTYPEDDTEDLNVFTVAFGTAEVLHGLGEPLGETDVVREDIYYSRSTDGGSTWLQLPWVVNPDSSSPIGGETVYRWPWLAHGTPHQGHAQIRMHPSGTRLYAIWHQWTDGDEIHVSPHDVGNDIWFRRIDFMTP